MPPQCAYDRLAWIRRDILHIVGVCVNRIGTVRRTSNVVCPLDAGANSRDNQKCVCRVFRLLPVIGNPGLIIDPAPARLVLGTSQKYFHRVPFPSERMHNIGKLFTAALVLLCLTVPAQADFMKGWGAYQRGEFTTALQHWNRLAEEGDPVAQYNVGVMYDEGTGVDRDPAKVVAWWSKAADQGHVMAQHNLALVFIEHGGEDDFRKAAYWLKRAAADGFVRSQYTLAKLYATGLGVEKDDARAFALFLKAGNAGFVKAQYNLGKIFRDGIGVEADPGISVSWFERAAKQGYAKAQEKLATRFARGTGVKSDVTEALKWAILATQHGRTLAQKVLNDLRKSMSRRQITEAESRAKAFRPVTAIRQ